MTVILGGMKGGAFVQGGKHNKRSSTKRSSRSRKLKGGGGPGPVFGSRMPDLTPYALTEGVNTLGTSSAPGADNFNFKPQAGWFSDQVGGASYGYDAASAADVPSFAGSYIPVSRSCTAGSPDNDARGGNNFTQAGGRRRRRRGKKGRKSKRTAKKWWQRGCSSSGGAKTKTKKKGKRSRRHRSMKGGLPIF